MKFKRLMMVIAVLALSTASAFSIACITSNDKGDQSNTTKPDGDIDNDIGNPSLEFTVTFNMNGHGTQVSPTQTTDGKVTEPTAPTADGYTFGGWYTDSACTTAFDFNTVLTGSTTLYAKWTANETGGGTESGGSESGGTESGGSESGGSESGGSETPATEYTVTFNMNGHGTQVSPTQTTDGKVTEPTAPTADGYTFGGWYIDSACTTAFDFNTVLTGSTTLYAKWTANETGGGTESGGTESGGSESGGSETPATEYTVTFNMNGHGTQIAPVQTGNGKVTAPTAPTADGYTFGGWYTDSACTTAFDFNTVLTGNTTLYASWARNEVTVSFDLNGHGTATIGNKTTVNGKITAPTAPTADGYTFGGWYETSACTGTEIDFATKEFSENTTLYAKWTSNQSTNLTYAHSGNESAAFEWTDSDAASATVEYKLSSATTYNALDSRLIRQTDETTARADVLGLKGGATYDFKITDGSGKISVISSVAISAYDRSGYAHFGYTDGVGAYNDDGTLKTDAVVVYVSEETKNTVTAKFGSTTYTGIVSILNNASKCSSPLVVRVIGTIAAATWNKIDYNENKEYSSQNLMPASVVVGINGKQLPTNSNTYQSTLISGGYNTLDTSVYSELNGLDSRAKYSDGEYDTIWNNCPIKGASNVTLEGVGEDARLFQWGLTWSNCNSIEVRNLTFEDYTEDACSFEGSDTSVSSLSSFNYKNIWIHYNTFEEGVNYWDLCAEQDKHEGDGATDFKGISNVTVSYNEYHNNHKTGLVGGSNSHSTANVTFHHNYYNNNTSRLPLARQANMHMYNNYYYMSTGTNMSLRAGAYAFIENCYFENANNPVVIESRDSTYGIGAAKIYGSTFTGKSPASNDYLYIVSDRTQTVTNENKFSQDFDTNSSVFYYDATNKCSDVENLLTAEQVKELVPTLAGVQKRLNNISGGISSGESTGGGSESGGSESGGGSQTVEETSVIIFSDGAKQLVDGELVSELDGFTISISADPKIKDFVYNGNTYSNSAKLNSSGSVTFTADKDCTAIVCYYDYNSKTNTSIKIGDVVYGGTEATLHSDANGYYHLVEVEFEAGVEYTIVRGVSSEISLCYMVLTFTE
ncbi:MAG: InlB B-repeat-containing protein [Candidatus Coproplasma sp.]